MITVPDTYRAVFSEVIESFPELSETKIEVILKDKHPVPYGTTPTLKSLFCRPEKRAYRISILEKAEMPVEMVLFKNLTKSAQKGVIAHELTHVLQFQQCSVAKLLRFMVSYPFPGFEKRLERAADKGAIERGFGEELYEHAVYIRSVPGYVKERPAIDKNYLLPYEIAGYLNSGPDNKI